MTADFTLYGLDVPELVLFGILIYLAALILVVVFVRCVLHKTFCPSSGEFLHCTYVNSCCTCPNCSLRQSAKSAFCCKRRHSVYMPTVPKCQLKCFRPDCNYLRCCCCEFFISEVQTSSPKKLNKVIDI